jgi:hypothetical protein
MAATRHAFVRFLRLAAAAWLGCGAVAVLAGCAADRPLFAGPPSSHSPLPGDSSIALHVPEEPARLGVRRARPHTGRAVAANAAD